MIVHNKMREFTIRADVSSRLNGDMRDKKNIELWLNSKKINPGDLIYGKQIHSNRVLVVGESQKGKKILQVDGFVTSTELFSKSLVLGIHTADCIPILLWDEMNGIIGAAHAGWRGLKLNMVHSVVCKMVQLGANVKNIKVLIGPHIQSCCYKVSKDIALEFSTINSDSVSHVKQNYYLNLEQVARYQLQKERILKDYIMTMNTCTFCTHDQYYSYRKDYPDTFGEQMSIISLDVYGT